MTVLALSTNYTELVIGCVIYGFGIGGMTGLTMVVMVQQLGLEKLAAAYGLNVFITGLVVFPGVVFFGKSLHLFIFCAAEKLNFLTNKNYL